MLTCMSNGYCSSWPATIGSGRWTKGVTQCVGFPRRRIGLYSSRRSRGRGALTTAAYFLTWHLEPLLWGASHAAIRLAVCKGGVNPSRHGWPVLLVWVWLHTGFQSCSVSPSSLPLGLCSCSSSRIDVVVRRSTTLSLCYFGVTLAGWSWVTWACPSIHCHPGGAPGLCSSLVSRWNPLCRPLCCSIFGRHPVSYLLLEVFQALLESAAPDRTGI